MGTTRTSLVLSHVIFFQVFDCYFPSFLLSYNHYTHKQLQRSFLSKWWIATMIDSHIVVIVPESRRSRDAVVDSCIMLRSGTFPALTPFPFFVTMKRGSVDSMMVEIRIPIHVCDGGRPSGMTGQDVLHTHRSPIFVTILAG